MSEAMMCREAVEVASDYIEGKLPRRERKRYEQHLAACPHCTRYLNQLRAVIEAAGRERVVAEELSDAARESLLEVYRAWKVSQ